PGRPSLTPDPRLRILQDSRAADSPRQTAGTCALRLLSRPGNDAAPAAAVAGEYELDRRRVTQELRRRPARGQRRDEEPAARSPARREGGRRFLSQRR